jgi:hypothetical protein
MMHNPGLGAAYRKARYLGNPVLDDGRLGEELHGHGLVRRHLGPATGVVVVVMMVVVPRGLMLLERRGEVREACGGGGLVDEIRDIRIVQ